MRLDIPYVPSSSDKVSTMVELASVQQGEKAVDLGSGDGRVVIELARNGALAYGFELDQDRVLLSQKNILIADMTTKTHIFNRSFWDVDLSGFDVITLYGITSIMEKLENKLKSELKTGARVVSNYFEFPNWEHKKNSNGVYLYVKE
jgi:cyclopropane fatty-acyl-phospholipid synthase-like methyltransferase